MKYKALAVAVAMAFSAGSALAANVGPADSDDVPVFGKEFIEDADTAIIVNPDELVWRVSDTDIIVGRNSSFNLRFTLGSGATFSLAVPGVAVTGAGFPCVVIAGGQVDDTFVTVSCDASPAAPLTSTATVGIPGTIKNVVSSIGAGGNLGATVQATDPNTATNLGDPVSGTFARGAKSYSFTVTPASGAPLIDVTDASLSFEDEESPVSLGTLGFAVNDDVRRPNRAPVVLADLTNADVRITGSLGAFVAGTTGNNENLYLTDNEGCGSGPDDEDDILATVANSSASQVTFSAIATLSSTYTVCAVPDGEDAIGEGAARATLLTIDVNSNENVAAGDNGLLANLRKNGFSAFFPSVYEDPVTVTFVRVSNNSSVDGEAFMTVRDDAGNVLLDNVNVGTVPANGSLLKSMAQLGVTLPAPGTGTILVTTTTPSGTTKAQVFTANTATGIITNYSASATNNTDGSN